MRASRRAFHLRWHLALVLALCVSLGGIADSEGAGLTGQRVQLATADQTEATARVVAGLRKRFPAAEATSALSPEAAQGGNAAVIAIGPAALSAVLARGTNGVIVSVFTSSQAYRDIVKGIPESKRAMVTGVYADPSLPDQLGLISAIYKRRVRVGVLLSQRTAYLLPQLTRSAQERDLELSVESVSIDRSLNESLNRLRHAAVILAVPDKAIYHAENIRNILLTAYRRNQPLIGFSTAFVKAGALASTYSDVDDVSEQVGQMLDEWRASGRLPEPQFPKYFRVAVNDSVARSLDLVIDEEVRALSRKPEVQPR